MKSFTLLALICLVGGLIKVSAQRSNIPLFEIKSDTSYLQLLDSSHWQILETVDKALIIDLANDLASNQEKIKHHGQRAFSIVKNMLEHSRMSTGSRDAMHGAFTMPKIETHFDPDLPLVSVIPQDIGRVLLNLINNAFYAVNQRAVETLHATSLQPTEYPFQLMG
jgi:nitrogen-specific signal transduction histidine kinase